MDLYEIDELLALRIVELIELIDGKRDDLAENCRQEIEELELEKGERLKQYWYAIKNLEANIDAFDAEIARLRRRRETTKTIVEWLKRCVMASLPVGTKFQDGAASFGWRKSESVELIGELNDTPECYRRTTWEPAKQLIKDDLKSGATIPGWKLVQKNNLQVR